MIILLALLLTFPERVQETINFYANRDGSYSTIAAKLYLKQNAADASKQLLALVNKGVTGDMFWMFQVTAVAHLDKGQLTPEARAALRGTMKSYMPYRGDTENHWLLYYTSLYLMAQLWDGESGDFWFTGKSSRENVKEAEAWINAWFDLTLRRGQGEYDCTHYMGLFLLSTSYLAEWSTDPVMRQRARLMTEYLAADYAAESLDGIFVGSHARTDDRMVLEKWSNVASDFGWLLFGVGRRNEPAAGLYALCYSLASAQPMPDILHRIATDRSQPYTHYERQRTRNRWRLAPSRWGDVYKTTYVRREYAVGSDQGGVLQPIQQHSWDVTWAVPDPRGVHNTLFTVHPYSSNDELMTYFTFGLDTGMETVVRSKKLYDSPEKLLGGSPFEQIAQDRDTVVVLYDIPAGTRFPHINGFFSKDLVVLVEDPSGWIFTRGGDAWIAYRPLAPYSWKPHASGGKRLFSPYLKNGAVVRAAPASEYPTLDAFRAAILKAPLEFKLEPKPSVRFGSIDFTYGETPKVNGRPLDYARWPRFGGPWVETDASGYRVTLKHGAARRVLDFNALQVSGVN